MQISWTANVSPAYVLSLLSATVSSIVDEKTVSAHAEKGDFGNGWLTTNSAGSGPYQIRKVVMHQAVILTANPTSPAGAPKIKNILIKMCRNRRPAGCCLSKATLTSPVTWGRPDCLAAGQKRCENRRDSDGLAVLHPVQHWQQK